MAGTELEAARGRVEQLGAGVEAADRLEVPDGREDDLDLAGAMLRQGVVGRDPHLGDRLASIVRSDLAGRRGGHEEARVVATGGAAGRDPVREVVDVAHAQAQALVAAEVEEAPRARRSRPPARRRNGPPRRGPRRAGPARLHAGPAGARPLRRSRARRRPSRPSRPSRSPTAHSPRRRSGRRTAPRPRPPRRAGRPHRRGIRRRPRRSPSAGCAAPSAPRPRNRPTGDGASRTSITVAAGRISTLGGREPMEARH